MELNIRRLVTEDWSTLKKWWSSWRGWEAPPKDFLPDDGTGGFMVEKQGRPIVAGFIYFTNSKGALLDWIVSDPEYKENDRGDAIELLIEASEQVLRDKGFKYIFSIGRNQSLINRHKKLGWQVDTKSSYELTKVI